MCWGQAASDPANECEIKGSSAVEYRDGIAVSEVTFASPSGPVTAHAFVPDSDKPVPGIVFSHSAIRSYKGVTDLLPFARAIARPGGASIVLDWAVAWEPLDDEANRSRSVMSCAAKWLESHVSLDPEHVGYAGPGRLSYVWHIAFPRRSSCCHLNFGTLWRADEINTENLMSVDGQM